MGTRMKLSEVLDRDEIENLVQPSNIKGFQALFTTWGIIAAALALVAYRPSILTLIPCLILLGGRQLALAILMHDASHYSLFKTRWLNDWVGSWLCAYPSGHDLRRYREHHIRHHQYAGSDRDPDLDLVSHFPTTPVSLRRKFLRDLLGITGLKRIYGILLMDFGLIQFTVSSNAISIENPKRTLSSTLKTALTYLPGKILAQSILFAFFMWIGKPWLYLIWLGAYLTTFSIFIRIRSIAEHACTIRDLDPTKNTRTTFATPLARLTVAPHRVNYHLEHHLLMTIPSFNLPLVHELLKERGALKNAYIAPGYLEVLATAGSWQN
jgi:fatty acid desaturase